MGLSKKKPAESKAVIVQNDQQEASKRREEMISVIHALVPRLVEAFAHYDENDSDYVSIANEVIKAVGSDYYFITGFMAKFDAIFPLNEVKANDKRWEGYKHFIGMAMRHYHEGLLNDKNLKGLYRNPALAKTLLQGYMKTLIKDTTWKQLFLDSMLNYGLEGFARFLTSLFQRNEFQFVWDAFRELDNEVKHNVEARETITRSFTFFIQMLGAEGNSEESHSGALNVLLQKAYESFVKNQSPSSYVSDLVAYHIGQRENKPEIEKYVWSREGGNEGKLVLSEPKEPALYNELALADTIAKEAVVIFPIRSLEINGKWWTLEKVVKVLDAFSPLFMKLHSLTLHCPHLYTDEKEDNPRHETLLRWLGQLNQLEYLDVSQSRLSEAFFQDLCSTKYSRTAIVERLRGIYCDDIKSVSDKPNIVTPLLTFLNEEGTQKRLEQLSLGNTHLNQLDLERVSLWILSGRAQHLQVLNLRSNSFSRGGGSVLSLVSAMGLLKKLKVFDYSGNLLQPRALAYLFSQLGAMSSLRKVRLDYIIKEEDAFVPIQWVKNFLHNNPALEEFSFSNNRLFSDDTRYKAGQLSVEITDKLKNNSIQYLDLSYNYLGERVLISIIEHLKLNHSLEVLKLDGLKMSFNTIVRIIDALKFHPGIKELTLNAPSFKLKHQEMYANELKIDHTIYQEQAVQALCELIRENTSIVKIGFQGCGLKQTDIHHLTEAMRQGKLVELDVKLNEIDFGQYEECELLLMSALPKTGLPEKKKMYLAKEDNGLRYLVQTPKGDKAGGFLDINIPNLTVDALIRHKSNILTETFRRGHLKSYDNQLKAVDGIIYRKDGVNFLAYCDKRLPLVFSSSPKPHVFTWKAENSQGLMLCNTQPIRMEQDDLIYSVLGMGRKEAYELVKRQDDKFLATFLIPAVKEALLTPEFVTYIYFCDRDERAARLKKMYAAYAQHPEYRNAEMLKEHAMSYMRHYLAYVLLEEPCQAKLVSSSILQLLAHLKKCALTLWKVDETEDIIMPYEINNDNIDGENRERMDVLIKEDAYIALTEVRCLSFVGKQQAEVFQDKSQLRAHRRLRDAESSQASSSSSRITNPLYSPTQERKETAANRKNSSPGNNEGVQLSEQKGKEKVVVADEANEPNRHSVNLMNSKRENENHQRTQTKTEKDDKNHSTKKSEKAESSVERITSSNTRTNPHSTPASSQQPTAVTNALPSSSSMPEGGHKETKVSKLVQFFSKNVAENSGNAKKPRFSTNNKSP